MRSAAFSSLHTHSRQARREGFRELLSSEQPLHCPYWYQRLVKFISTHLDLFLGEGRAHFFSVHILIRLSHSLCLTAVVFFFFLALGAFHITDYSQLMQLFSLRGDRRAQCCSRHRGAAEETERERERGRLLFLLLSSSSSSCSSHSTHTHTPTHLVLDV